MRWLFFFVSASRALCELGKPEPLKHALSNTGWCTNLEDVLLHKLLNWDILGIPACGDRALDYT